MYMCSIIDITLHCHCLICVKNVNNNLSHPNIPYDVAYLLIHNISITFAFLVLINANFRTSFCFVLIRIFDKLFVTLEDSLRSEGNTMQF